MQTRVIESLGDIPADQWNTLVRDDNPFLSHQFLHALETTQCVGEEAGWYPQHIVCYNNAGELIGALPLYLKDNSYGEFIFDWSWADAYQRNGISYYPKLVSAIPFTPATGQRLLVKSGSDHNTVQTVMIEQTLELAEQQHCSSIHCLFPLQHETAAFCQQGFHRRIGCQFHWQNQNYHDFTDFLDALSSKKRKNIKRERRLVQDADVQLRTLLGSAATENEWHSFYEFYRATFYKRGRHPYMTRDFFNQLGHTMGDQIVLVIASKLGQDVAAAISFKSKTTLYGRHWGCLADYDSLHFETCFYQGIEFCIEHGLQVFEPGAQGEHKIWRGFLPTITYSAHWLAHQAFADAVADFLRRETPAIQDYARELKQHSPYREIH